jgi:hypothetical protein
MTSKFSIISILPAIDRSPRRTPAVQVQAVSYPARPCRITTWLHRSATPSHLRRAMLAVLIIGLMLASWWGFNTLSVNAESGYLASDPFAIALEVSGPNTVDPMTHNWCARLPVIAPTRRSSCGRTSNSTAGTDSWLFSLNRDPDQRQ